MYIVKADNQPVGFHVEFEAFDSEGNPVEEESLVVAVESDNSDAVSIEFDEASQSGTASFGSPGLANINVTVSKEDGTLLGSFGAQFTVVAGDPSTISGGSVTFDGLTEV